MGPGGKQGCDKNGVALMTALPAENRDGMTQPVVFRATQWGDAATAYGGQWQS
jgi:hypothetical protein